MLKCPICGMKYSYESKICKACEDYLKYSGLAKYVEKSGYKGEYTHKWNCAVFLKDDNFIFAVRRRPRVYAEITNEPFNLQIKPARNYEWNIESARRFKSSLESLFVKSKVAVDSELIDDIMKVIARKSDLLLIYE